MGGRGEEEGRERKAAPWERQINVTALKRKAPTRKPPPLSPSRPARSRDGKREKEGGRVLRCNGVVERQESPLPAREEEKGSIWKKKIFSKKPPLAPPQTVRRPPRHHAGITESPRPIPEGKGMSWVGGPPDPPWRGGIERGSLPYI